MLTAAGVFGRFGHFGRFWNFRLVGLVEFAYLYNYIVFCGSNRRAVERGDCGVAVLDNFEVFIRPFH